MPTRQEVLLAILYLEVVMALALAAYRFGVYQGELEARAEPPKYVFMQAREPWYVKEKNCAEVYRTCRARNRNEGIRLEPKK